MPVQPPILSSDIKVKAAWLYHVEGMTQEQIAGLMDVSRVKVMRLLAECQAEGLVVTRIDQVAANQVMLERRLEQELGLGSAVVFPAAASPEGLERGLAYSVADVLRRSVAPGMTLAVGSGATLFHSLKYLEASKLEGATIVGLVGALPHSGWINPSSVALRMGELFGVSSYQITAPVLVDDEDLASRLWEQSALREVRARAANADLAVLTVGDHAPDATVFRYGLIPDSHFASLSEAGAVANILCRFVDAQGREVPHELNRRVMAIDLQEVARIPRIILAAAGAHRLTAIRAALAAVPVTTFITDEDTARALLGS